MGTAVFPTLAGLKFSTFKTPTFKTQVQTTASGKENRAAFWSYPKWKIDLSYEFLRDDVTNELQTLLGFFLSRGGRFDNFNFTDPDDNAVVNQSFGTGDGVTTAFRLARTYAGYMEPVFRVNGAPTIKKAGVTQTVTTHYTIDGEGLVTFVTAPASGAALTWTGSFYYRVRFVEDVAEFEQFMRKLWLLKKLSLVTDK